MKKTYQARVKLEDLPQMIGEAVLRVYETVKNGSTKGADITIHNDLGEKITIFVCPPGMKAQAYFEQ
jgi:hypothetical protein